MQISNVDSFPHYAEYERILHDNHIFTSSGRRMYIKMNEVMKHLTDLMIKNKESNKNNDLL